MTGSRAVAVIGTAPLRIRSRHVSPKLEGPALAAAAGYVRGAAEMSAAPRTDPTHGGAGRGLARRGLGRPPGGKSRRHGPALETRCSSLSCVCGGSGRAPSWATRHREVRAYPRALDRAGGLLAASCGFLRLFAPYCGLLRLIADCYSLLHRIVAHHCSSLLIAAYCGVL